MGLATTPACAGLGISRKIRREWCQHSRCAGAWDGLGPRSEWVKKEDRKDKKNISRGLVLAKEKRELYVNTCKSNEEKKE